LIGPTSCQTSDVRIKVRKMDHHYGKSVTETLQSIEEHEIALASLRKNTAQIRLELSKLDEDAEDLINIIETERASITASIHRLPPELLIRVFRRMLEPQDLEYPQRHEVFTNTEKRTLMLVC